MLVLTNPCCCGCTLNCCIPPPELSFREFGTGPEAVFIYMGSAKYLYSSSPVIIAWEHWYHCENFSDIYPTPADPAATGSVTLLVFCEDSGVTPPYQGYWGGYFDPEDSVPAMAGISCVDNKMVKAALPGSEFSWTTAENADHMGVYFLNSCYGTPCCTLPPYEIELTSYAWSGYDFPYEEAVYTFDPITPPTIGNYHYVTTTTIPAGAGVGGNQTQQILLTLSCNSGAFVFANTDFNPLWPSFLPLPDYAFAGSMLVPLVIPFEEYYWWPAPPSDSYMDDEFKELCPDITGSVRHWLTPCNPAIEPFVGEIPFSIAPVEGDVYYTGFYSGPYSSMCLTVGAEAGVFEMANAAIESMVSVTGCGDAAC